MPHLRVLLLVVYIALFLAATTVWAVFRLRKPTNFALPPASPQRAVLWGRSAVQFRHWSAPVPTTQATDPLVQQVGANSSGTSVRGSSAPADLYAHSSGYYWAGGLAWAFRDIGFHYHVIWWATAPAPLLAAMAYARRRRRMSGAGGRCVGCGYDLRATPERCPECGRLARQPGS